MLEVGKLSELYNAEELGSSFLTPLGLLLDVHIVKRDEPPYSVLLHARQVQMTLCDLKFMNLSYQLLC